MGLFRLCVGVGRKRGREVGGEALAGPCSWHCNKNLSHLLLLGVYEFGSRDVRQVLSLTLSFSLCRGLALGFWGLAGWQTR